MLQLHRKPSSILSSPDSSCFFAIDEPLSDSDTDESVSLSAYHWSSFGSSEGIQVNIPRAVLPSCTLTSLHSRNNVYLMGLDVDHSAVISVAFTITRRITEFTFKERGAAAIGHNEKSTRHNSIVDCHYDVWSRFPVVPAVRRETVKSGHRGARSLLFVSDIDHSPIQGHFSCLVDDLERTTRKPVGEELKNIKVLAADHNSFLDDIEYLERSTFLAGEWLVELLCLIPIHIAVTRDNRFIPIKDGVQSMEFEKTLLGADVAKIVDTITFGWYESIFLSYMAKKVSLSYFSRS